MPAYTYDQFCADLDAAFADSQPNEPAPLPIATNDNAIDPIASATFDREFLEQHGMTWEEFLAAPVEPAPFVDRRPLLERYGFEVGPNGVARKISDATPSSNDPQVQAAHGIAPGRNRATPLAPSTCSLYPSL